VSQYPPNFHVKGTSPPIICVWIDRTMNALQLCRWLFSHKGTLYQTFFKRSAILPGKRPFCVFYLPFGGLGATYDNHLRLIGKRVVDFLLVLRELLSQGVTYEALRANISSKSVISLKRRPDDPKFQVEGVAPPTILLLLRKLG